MLLFQYKGVVTDGASMLYNCGAVSLVVRISLGPYRILPRWMAGGIQGAAWCHGAQTESWPLAAPHCPTTSAHAPELVGVGRVTDLP